MDDPITHPRYVTSLEEIIWGILLVTLTLVIHGFGMLWTLRFNNAFQARFEQRSSFVLGMSNLILASWLVLFIHLTEVMMWAGFFQRNHCFANFSTAAYFALNEYTTVGSALNLPQNWRLLEGMIATAGLLGFAWSTGVLLTLAQGFQDQQMQIIKQRRQKRASHLPPAPDPHVGGTQQN